MRQLSFLLVILPLFVSCATAYKNHGGPEGQNSYVIDCDAAYTNQCFAKAKEVCPQGFKTTEVSTAASFWLLPLHLRTVQVVCK